MKSGYLLSGLLLLSIVAGTSLSQSPRGGSRNRARPTRETLFRLLDMPTVRKEIGLSASQIEILTDLQADLTAQRRVAFSSGGPLDSLDPRRRPGSDNREQESRDRFDAMREAVEKIREQGEKLVAVILDKKQVTRLNQLRIQDEGTRALDRAAIREQVGVTDEQFAQIRDLRRADVDPTLSRRRRQQLLDKDVLALLDEGQRAKFNELKGPAFEFPLPLPADLRGLRDPRDESRSGRPSSN